MPGRTWSGPSHGTLEARLGQPDGCERPCAIQFGLQQRAVGVHDVGARGDARREALEDDALGLGRTLHALAGGADGRAVRVQLEPALADLEGDLAIELRDARLRSTEDCLGLARLR